METRSSTCNSSASLNPGKFPRSWITHILGRKTAWTSIGFWLISCSHAWSQFGPLPESVENVRSALRHVGETSEAREQRLIKSIDGLQNIREKREAFLLSEWRDQQPDLPASVADRKVRASLGDKIASEYHAVLQSQDQQKILLLLERLPDLSRQAEDSVLVAKLVPVETRRVALVSLARIHADADLMLPLLTELIRDPIPEIRLASAESIDTLLRLQLPGSLARGTNHPVHLRREALSKHAAKLIPVALFSLKDSQSQVRILSSDTLRLTASLFSSMISDPGQSLAGIDPSEIRRLMQTEWAELDPLLQVWKTHLPALSSGLVDRNSQVRLNCQRTLDELAGIRIKRLRQGEALGVDFPDVLADPIRQTLPTLVEALRDPDIRVRRAAIDVLEGLGTLASPASREITTHLDDADPFVRWACLRALGAMGPDALKSAEPKIRAMVQDPDPDVRKSVETCMRRLGS
jgi:HEAT repeat protein